MDNSSNNSDESDFEVVPEPWRQKFWTAISAAAKEKRCFAGVDYDITYDLNGDMEKFIPLRTWVNSRYEHYVARAGKPEFVYMKDGQWELIFVKKPRAPGGQRGRGKRYRPGFIIEGLDDNGCEPIDKNWETVDGGDIPQDEVNVQLVNPPRKCIVM